MKKSVKLISIITPAYNAEKYIERCVKSVINQTYKNIEHIIVDDGSTDNTGKILDKLKKSDERIKVIHKNNEGVSKARNVALEEACGEYVLFADADDWLEPNMCEELINKILETKSDVVICEYYNFFENSGNREKISLKEIKGLSFPDLISDDDNKYGGFPWNKLIRIDKIKFDFDESVHFYENLLFFLQNFDDRTKYSVIHKPLYNYCINDNSAVHSKKFNMKKVSTLNALSKVIPFPVLYSKLSKFLLLLTSSTLPSSPTA